MHIPDGYLSPSTCAALYGSSFPFWYVALKKMKHQLQARSTPLIAMFAAFCFVVMMFNVPVPGGTSDHALGIGITAAMLGPWPAIMAMSIALAIQALLFGDGGVTTLGANCFNMAIVGSLVAGFSFRLLRGRALGTSTSGTSGRAALACALSGYLAVNVAALFAAIEFGVQPLWFKDAHGAPLYAPYPLRIAIPAMMMGHLTIAGLAEAFLSGGMFAYLQRTNPALLKRFVCPDEDRVAPRNYGIFWWPWLC